MSLKMNPPPYDSASTVPPSTQPQPITQALYPSYPTPPYPNQQPPYPNQQPPYPNQQIPYPSAPYPNQQPPYPNQQTYQPQQQYTGLQPPPPSVVVVNSGQPQMIGYSPRPYQSFCGHIALACFVFWCCGFLFGLIAFILALVAKNSAETGQTNEARNLGRASLGVSIAGIVITCLIIAITVGVSVSSRRYISSSTSYSSNCYCKMSSFGSYAYRSCYLCYN